MWLSATYKNLVPALAFLLISNAAFTQNNTGMATGNYAGISGIWMNPANIVDSRYKFDINVIGVNSYYNNNYLLVKNAALVRRLFYKDPYNSSFADVKKDLLEEGKVNGKVFARTEGNIRLPLSFLITTGKKSAIAFTMNNRTINKVDSLDPATAKMFYDELGNAGLYNIAMNNDGLRQNFLNWQDLGLTYGRVIINKGSAFLKLAVTGKWLGAGAAGFIQADKATVSFKDAHTMSLNAPLIRYGRTETADIGQFSRKNLFNNLEDQSWGFDAGMVFEWRGNISKFKYQNTARETELQRDLNKYIFRIGFAVVDIGQFNFTRKPLTNDHRANFSNWDFAHVKANNFSDFDTAYSRQINYVAGSSSTFTYRLPGAAIINADLHLFGGFYVNVAAKQPLAGYGKKADTYIESDRWTVVTPRFEGKFLGIYIPVTKANNQTNVGATIKFGPLYVGSNNLAQILSNKKSMEADFHAGLRLSILQGKPNKLLKTLDRYSNEKRVSDKDTRRMLDSLSNEVNILKANLPKQPAVTVIINNGDGTKSEVLRNGGDTIIIENKSRSANNNNQGQIQQDTTTDYLIRQLAASNLEVKKMQEQADEKSSTRKSKNKKSAKAAKPEDPNKALEEEIEKLRKENKRQNNAIIAATTAAGVATVVAVSSKDKKKDSVINIKDSVVGNALTDSVKSSSLQDSIHQNTDGLTGDTNQVYRKIMDTVFIRDTVYISTIQPGVSSTLNDKKQPAALPVYDPIYFANGSTSLKAADIGTIKKLAKDMSKLPQTVVEVTGRTDASGSAATNKNIAMSRATAVKNILLTEGINDNRIDIKTIIGNNGKKSAEARRVDIILATQ